MGQKWLTDAKDLSTPGVALQLGLTVRGQYSTCPSGCVQRGGGDRRLPVTMYSSGRWKCYACQATGDVIDLISYAVAGGRYAGQPAVKEWLVQGGEVRVDIKEGPVIKELHYAPLEEVHEMWHYGTVGSYEVSRWLDHRLGVDAAASVRPLVRQMPLGGSLPKWARSKVGDWRQAGYLGLFPMWDHLGVMRGLRARQVLGRPGHKSAGPAGCRGNGLVLACPLALEILRGGKVRHGLVICEGEPAFLGWASRRREAVIGIGSGWWSMEFAARVPAGTRVLLATDHDEAGDRYAAHVELSLRGRAAVTRAQ